eukprot:gene13819-19735_t
MGGGWKVYGASGFGAAGLQSRSPFLQSTPSWSNALTLDSSALASSGSLRLG